MKRCSVRFWLLNASAVYALLGCYPTAAQIVPDATLRVNSVVTPDGNTNVITGGTTSGTNLFHSFSEFSIPTDSAAFFNNALDIQNILMRVTGGSISNIDGILRANGTANLFLLNPNGIIFGAGARLNIGGSFLASTANSINFADGNQFSATNPQTTPLLTISMPIGLQLGQSPGKLVVQGRGYDLSVQDAIFSPITRGNSSTGLKVVPGKTLALVGGDVELVGGTLTAEQGHIELGSVRNGQVSLSPIASGFALSYQGVQRFGDIQLSRQALADASGGGSIQVQGNRVTLTDGSIILIQNQGEQQAGSISTKAAQSLEVSSTNPKATFNGGLRSETTGSGSGATIAISTPELMLQGGAAINTRSFSTAKAGNLTVAASDSVQVIGVSPIRPALPSAISAMAFSSGDAGNVIVSTRRLTVLNGGAIASLTLGIGDGGELTVNALDSIELIGQSSIFGPSIVNALSGSDGDGGKVTINTSRLMLRDGGTLSSSTFATGSAGSITINASESVEVSGSVLGDPTPSSIGSSAPILAETLQRADRLPPVPSGASGDVSINTPALNVTDGARVEVSNEGVGNAGTLRVNANSIFLDSQGSIMAETKSSTGGNIQLQVRDLLLMRHNSEISASAGGNGNGGNISINTPLLVALPRENSDISANAENSFGGRVVVNASGIFGTQFRPGSTPLSDITASSALGPQFSGIVQLNTPDIDPNRGLVTLPANVIDSSQLIANNCIGRSNRREGKFIITGNGGLPVTPDAPLVAPYQTYQIPTVQSASVSGSREREGDREASKERWRSMVRQQQSAERTFSTNSSNSTPPTASPLVEATGWKYGEEGEVILIAQAPTVAPHSSIELNCILP
jgi:filamentous hemagglutinin family protein